LAIIATDEAQWSLAEELIAEALQLSEQSGTTEYWMVSAAHLARSRLLAARGETSGAEAEAERSLELAHRGGGTLRIAQAMLNLAELRRAEGREEDASSLLREAHRIIERCPDPGLAALRLKAGRPHQRELKAGRAERAMVEELSERELSILRRLDSSLSQREIGSALHLSLNTVKTHTSHIFRKLGVSNRADAVVRARSLGLLQWREPGWRPTSPTS
jgi:LuxR family maltose regulon positive regulatory protein